MTSSEQTRSFWSTGDYDAVSRVIADLGPALVRAAGVQPGDRVLDVGAGTGNATLPAARAGGLVTALDPTPELTAVGARRALAEGLSVTWTTGVAEALPFPDAAFDVVLSCVGRDVRARPRRHGARAAARVPAGRGARHGELDAGRSGGPVLRAAGPVRRAGGGTRADRVGGCRARAGPARGRLRVAVPAGARPRPHLRRRLRAAGRAVPGELRAGDRHRGGAGR